MRTAERKEHLQDLSCALFVERVSGPRGTHISVSIFGLSVSHLTFFFVALYTLVLMAVIGQPGSDAPNVIDVISTIQRRLTSVSNPAASQE
jgi:hypothetical protein